MPSRSTHGPAKLTKDVRSIVAELRDMSSKKYRDGLARYAIPSEKAFGVPVGAIQKLGKRLGRNHELAEALWQTGWYEARMLATFVDEPERVTPAQMDRWCRDFDSWAICDTACFHLFDRTPHAFRKVAQWAKRREEFVKRSAFALLACTRAARQTDGRRAVRRSVCRSSSAARPTSGTSSRRAWSGLCAESADAISR